MIWLQVLAKLYSYVCTVLDINLALTPPTWLWAATSSLLFNQSLSNMAKKIDQTLFSAMSKVGNLLWMGNISLPLAPVTVLPQKLLKVKLLLKDNFTLNVNIQVIYFSWNINDIGQVRGRGYHLNFFCQQSSKVFKKILRRVALLGNHNFSHYILLHLTWVLCNL